MAGIEERALRKLERQIAKTQRRLTKAERRKGRRGSFVGGMFLGTVAGGLLTYYLAQRHTEDEWEPALAGDKAIVLREQPTPTGQTATVKPPPPRDAATTGKGSAAAIAATNLERPEAAEEAKPEAKAPAAQQAPQAEQPVKQEAAEPTRQGQPAKQEAKPVQPPQQEAEQEQPARAAQQPEGSATPLAAQQATVLPGETRRPEIVLAKAGAQTTGEAEEGRTTPAKVQPQPEMRAEPVDGVCPASHPIKGNRGSMGALIYHVPDGRNYDRTKPEACFATVADAEAAGYRPPRG